MNIAPYYRTGSRNQRQGVAIIIVIAFYAVAVTLFSVWIRTALGHQRQARLVYENRQAVWLADAGLRRAAARLTNNSNYTGENWQIEATQLGGNHAAAVDIRIEAIESATDTEKLDDEVAKRVRIIATAELPAGTKRHVRHTKSTEINLTQIN